MVGWEIFDENGTQVGAEPAELVLSTLYSKYPNGCDVFPVVMDTNEGKCRVFIKCGIWDGLNWKDTNFNETGIYVEGIGSGYAKIFSKIVPQGTKIKILARGASEVRTWNQGNHGETILGFYDESGNVLKSSGSGLIFTDSYEVTANGSSLVVYTGYEYWYRD